MKLFVVFPTDLVKDLSYYENCVVCLVEEQIYFKGTNTHFKFNPLKPIYHRATMKCYYDYLKQNKIKTMYVDFSSNWTKLIKSVKCDELLFFDPVNRALETIIKKSFPEYTIINSPRFYLTIEELKTYDGPLRHQSFYAWVRHKKDLLMIDGKPIGGKMSYDADNRKKPYNDIEHDIPNDPNYDVKKNEAYLNDAVKYVVKNIPYNDVTINCSKDVYHNATKLEDLSLKLLFPINHKDTKNVFRRFIKEKIIHFGDYQDIILDADNSILFHSGISPMLNIGLITPDDVVNELIFYYDQMTSANKKKQIHNIEGYLRQIVGWRELCRMTYELHYDEIVGKNFFDAKNKLDDSWYTGTTGILPVDDCIKKAFSTGYLHHIERLMIIANIMTLKEIEPLQVYKWFTEFSLDSYDWVMCYNIYCMATYSTGTYVTKPYISSSNYVLKMSNYKKDNDWNVVWDNLFWGFLKKHKKKIKKISRLAMLLKYI